MTTNAAFITPVPRHLQQAALRHLDAGRKTEALKALRAESDLPLADAPAALALLADQNLPATTEDAAALLADREPVLWAALVDLLDSGRRRAALGLLRDATGVGLVTAQRITTLLGA
ncbi:hypothetical protein [Kitasatospora sp. NPDC094011]|uniref:hypothetical protein n=1 Tax=Kitasatospora sp. NPDC094011 TaxID=3364090 RepID=UPI0037F7E803